MTHRDILKPFGGISKEDVGTVGGKGASLGELSSIGIAVPPGFVILAGLSRRYRSTGLPQTVGQEILAAFDTLGSTRVAVRSSALVEDSADASWAGQFESFLNVDRDHLLESIKLCWESAHSSRVLAYAGRQAKKDHRAVAVVIQAMVDSESSGVLFTANPLTGNAAELVIEASYGLGEMVVQGKVSPDHYTLNKKSLQFLSRDIKRKNIQLVFRHGRNAEVPVQAALATKPAISDAVVERLARLGVEIEAHYGAPQDIEWAVQGDKLYILQARPITTLGSREAVTETAEIPVLMGLGAAPGVAYGKVRIIVSAAGLSRAREGEVLVAPRTTPEFTEAFGKMRAVVTNTGGMASHAAIVSRELDIPAVVGTLDATSKLKTGDLVTVDGYSGKVYSGRVKIAVSNEQPEPDHVTPSTGNDVDDMVNSLVSDPMDTREFWPLAPGSLMSYFDVDQAIDMYKKIGLLLRDGWDFERVAALFKRAQLVRYFIVNSGLVGIKVARGLQIAPLTVHDQVQFADWLTQILKAFQAADPFNLQGKNAAWSDAMATDFAKSHAWHTADDEARECLNLAAVQLFTLNWSFYGDYYGPIGLAMHGAYPLGHDRTLLVREYFRAPTEIWDLGRQLPYDHLIIAQQYEDVALYVNYSNRLLNKKPVSKHNVSYLILKDGKEIDLRELRQILVMVSDITKRQTAYVEGLPDMDKVRKWAQMAYYAHKDFYLHFGKQWYDREAVESMINKFGDRFLVDQKLAKPQNRPIEYRKMLWDPRNDYYPGKEPE